MKRRSKLLAVTVAMSVFFTGCGLLESEKGKYPIPDNTEKSLNDWKLEDSVINGAKFTENKSIYLNDNLSEVVTFYITVYPTKNSDGNIVTFKDFDLHEARDKDYNPEVEVLIQEGDGKGLLPSGIGYTDISPNASMRVRGNSSRGASIKSYKVKLSDKAGEWRGQTTLNLNKHAYDPSKIANKFCMDYMAKFDNFGSFRTKFVHLYIKDMSTTNPSKEFVDYGLYTHIEQPNKDYLRARGLDENGNLYKASNFEFRYDPKTIKDVDDPTYDPDLFGTVLDFREGKNHKKLIEMLKEVNDFSKDFDQTFDKYFNKENYLTWLAINILFGNEDTIAHNFIIYNPQNSNTWYFLPWDYDGTFKFGKQKGSYNAPEELYGLPRYSGVILHNRFFADIKNVNLLTNKIKEVYSQINKDDTQKLLNEYKKVLRKFVANVPDISLQRMPPNEIEGYLDGFQGYIDDNYKRYLKTIEYPMPVFTDIPETMPDGRVKFAWETSRDYQGDLLKYNITLSTDPLMKNIVFEKKGLIETEVIVSEIEKGKYFLKLDIEDSSGNRQYSRDTYTDLVDEAFYYGIREVEVK